MNDCCILIRRRDGSVHAIQNDDGSVKVWPTPYKAINDFESFPSHDEIAYQLVELDEL